MRKIIFLIYVMFSISLCVLAKKTEPAWGVIHTFKGATAEITGVSSNGFTLTLKRESGNDKASITAFKNINRAMPSQNKLIFSARAVNNNPVKVTPLISYQEQNRTIMKFGPKIIVSGTAWKDYQFTLDSAFGLSDALFNIRQLKFAVNISEYPAGTVAGAELKNIKLCAPDEAGFSVSAPVISVLTPFPVSKNGNRLKVYFHLDNDDLSTIVHNRRIQPGHDVNAYAGYRAMLLESVKDQAVITDSLQDADVIVYSSCSPEPEAAKKIAAAVRNGKKLYAASEIADPEIAKLLPVTIKNLSIKGYPKRYGVKFAGSGHSVAPKAVLNKSRFGKYQELTLNPGSKPIIVFEDGSPAVVEGKSGKGSVIYTTFTLGADLIPGTDAKDAFMLHAVSYLSKRKLSVGSFKETYTVVDGWRKGADVENFGRFGVRLGDGLLCEDISNSLGVSNGSAEYVFSSRATPKISLERWSFQDMSKRDSVKEQTWQEKWDNIGKVELIAKCVIPESWKGNPVNFIVEKGIDDLGEVYFNGTLIGKITKDDTHYWETMHNHSIPQGLIKYNGDNTIRVVSENLRGKGGFGSCPEVRQMTKSRPLKVKIDRINWLGKGGVISESDGSTRRYDTSLAFPGIRWDIKSKKVDLSLHNLADYAAFSTKNGVTIVNLHKQNELSVDWNAPWLLLFGKENPLLLVFQHKMSSVKILKTGNKPTALKFISDNDIGVIVPVWLYGRSSVKDAGSWAEKLPQEVVKRIDFWYPKAFCYPVACREFFRIDEQNKRVEIKSNYEYAKTQDDWNTSVKPYAPVSPVAYSMKDRLFKSDQVENWNLATGFGFYAARDNADTVFWSLPLPSPVLSVLPDVSGLQDIKDHINKIFASASRWSAGGHTKFNDWTPQYPMGKKYQTQSISMHAWVMGLNYALSGLFLLTDSNLDNLKNRVRIRYYSPIECFRYKMATRWREEPFSGIRYPIYFNSLYKHSTEYEGRLASNYDYGDQNETAMMIISMGQKLTDFYGQRDLITANWSLFRDAARLPLVSDDWAYMSCHCRESGGAATIDMLNCEYALMIKLARIAQIAGDMELYDEARYRAARRMVPTIARFYMKDYAVKNLPVVNPRAIEVSLGFKESGVVFRYKSDKHMSNQLFDMSQGVESDLLELYRRYALPEVREYLNNVIKQGNIDYEFAGAIAELADIPNSELMPLFEKLVNNKKLTRKLENDWPGIKIIPGVTQVLYRLKGRVMIETAKDVDIHHAEYNSDSKTLVIDATAGMNSRLVLVTDLEPVDSGKYKKSNSLIPIELIPSGRQKYEIKFH